MSTFEHQRHKPPTPLARPRELILVCAPLRSSVNLSRIVRAAGCSGVTRMVVTGNAKIDPKIARDGLNQISLEPRRSLPPVLKKLREEGYQLVGLEQTTDSQSLCEFSFARRTALVIGNERTGLTDDLLALLDHVVEIPVFGLPYSFNVATATAIAMYEYCRQFPSG
jgi:tRNA G18 (ribose-2'-O)-methylase SpoU